MTRRESESRKNTVAYVIFATLVILTVLCIILIFWLRSKRGENEMHFTVTIDGQLVTNTLDMDKFSLTPGATTEYTLTVNCEEGGRYALKFVFDGTADEALAACVRVEIACGEELLTSATLVQTLAGETLVLTQDFQTDQGTDFTVRYIMDANVGNETQGTRADFDVLLTAQKA